ncbi:flavodoxin family protein [Paludibacter sp.]|uniref:flavodoxin family protein n=1 Tax=Paludibacter sp. TaxID=1898105 RepID=UPI00135513E9|nr:flavodoxin family protein [Paludibacter sp.]MTK53901.1 flavodoxin family protein [Paludibacter sp.]
MKKVLILSGSPRKGGNSDLLCDRLMEGAQSAGHQTEKIYVKDKNIHYCTGCGVCYDKRVCSQKDDMTEVLAKMIATDVIVMATPVYFYSLNGQIKTLIDRCCARYTEISNKEFCFIMTAADGNKNSLERTLESFRGFTDCLNGATEKGVIYGTGVWQKGEVKGKSVMDEAYRMGASL